MTGMINPLKETVQHGLYPAPADARPAAGPEDDGFKLENGPVEPVVNDDVVKAFILADFPPGGLQPQGYDLLLPRPFIPKPADLLFAARIATIIF